MDYPIRAQTGIEAVLIMLLPSQYHWLVMVFREAADSLWSWLPFLIAIYALYQFILYQISRRVATFQIEGVLTEILQDPATSIGQTIAVRARDIVQQYVHAAVAEMTAQVTEVERMMSKAAKKSATTAEMVVDLESEFNTVKSAFRGQLPLPLRRAITEVVHSVAKTTIQKATQETVNKLALRHMHWKENDLRMVQRQVYGHERWLHKQAQTIARLINTIDTLIASYTTAHVDHTETINSLINKIDTLTAAQSDTQAKDAKTITLLSNKIETRTTAHSATQAKQAQTITMLTEKVETLTAARPATQADHAETIARLHNKIDALTAADSATQAHLSKLQGTADDHSVQVENIPKLIAEMSKLQSSLKVFADPHGQPKTDTSTTSKITGRLEGLERTLAELVITTDRHRKALKLFKDLPSNVTAADKRLCNCEGHIEHTHRKVDGVLDAVERLQADLQTHREELEVHKEDLEGHEDAVEHLRLDVAEHAEDLEKYGRWLTEDQEDFKELRADVEAIQDGDGAVDPVASPEMDAAFDEELLAGDERAESDVDAEGETDDEAGL
ncbi:hypothetical protein SVAN01_07022 [Stagonosporopsis vannaccii]|nr:hypothetical protein SVAN01_07022 [Stagonosporopsis vannaccii]